MKREKKFLTKTWIWEIYLQGHILTIGGDALKCLCYRIWWSNNTIVAIPHAWSTTLFEYANWDQSSPFLIYRRDVVSIDNLEFQKTNIGHIFWTQPYALCFLACYAIHVDLCILYWLFEFFLPELQKKYINGIFLFLKVPKLYSRNTIVLLIGFQI